MAKEYEEPDFWSRKAFAEGYPARSVYKLKEMCARFPLVKRGGAVLDLGAAPGSWSAFVLRTFGGRVTAVDLRPLGVPDAGLTVIQGDMCDAGVRRRAEAGAPYDTVLCDAAPSTTGSRAVDTARSEALAEAAAEYAASCLAAGGAFAAKIFQGGGEGALLRRLREEFASARSFKPRASRSGSFEIYLIGLRKKSCGAAAKEGTNDSHV